MNKITIIGRLTCDPQIRDVNGTPVCNFRIASDTRRKDANGDYITNFYNVDVWRGLGENCVKYLHKGDRASVVGDLSLRTYVDGKGEQRFSLDVMAGDVEFLMDKRSEAAPTKAQTSQATNSASVQGQNLPSEDDDEDLPF